MFNAAATPQAALFLPSVEAAAPQFMVKAIAAPVRGLEEVEAVITRLASEPTGLIFPPDPFTVEHHKIISELANRYGLPAVSESWSRKSEQGDKWSFCLTAGTLCPANQERP
jgi:hypothetical protein